MPPVLFERSRFTLLCEIEPPRVPDLSLVHEQIAVLRPVADAFLVPDNHLGHATMSSISVAREVAAIGGRSVACLNARDRNTLGLQRDLITAASYGVDHFLFVGGDPPSAGHATGDLNVRTMFEEARRFTASDAFARFAPFRLGATVRGGRSTGWRADADFLVAQVEPDLDTLVAWRSALRFRGPVLAAVLVLASAAMARRMRAPVPGIAVPEATVARLERDTSAGPAIACEQLDAIRTTGAFDGVHLIPGRRFREMAAALPPRPLP
jgi:5,10-methylenetetrahydrofolate reductase